MIYLNINVFGFQSRITNDLFPIQVRGVKKSGIGVYYKNGWNIKDAIMIVVSFIVIGMYVMRFYLTDQILSTFRKDPTLFVNFQIVGIWDEYFSCVMGLLVFIFTIDLMRILSFNQNVSTVFIKTISGFTLPYFLYGTVILYCLNMNESYFTCHLNPLNTN